MNVSRNVIHDLVPLYLADEASADTRALIEEFLAADPELAGQARGQAELVIHSFIQPLHWTIEIRWSG